MCWPRSATSFRSTSTIRLFASAPLWRIGSRGLGSWMRSAPRMLASDREQLITAFVDKIAELCPQLVTFNGNSFDCRSPLPGYDQRSFSAGTIGKTYFNRYSDDALDLCDVLSSFSAQGKATLNELSKIMGFRGKLDGIDGGEVHRYFRRAGSRRSPIIARRTSSIPTGFGCAMSCFAAAQSERPHRKRTWPGRIPEKARKQASSEWHG